MLPAANEARWMFFRYGVEIITPVQTLLLYTIVMLHCFVFLSNLQK